MEESESEEGTVSVNGFLSKRIKLEAEDSSNEEGNIILVTKQILLVSINGTVVKFAGTSPCEFISFFGSTVSRPSIHQINYRFFPANQ